MKSGQFYKGMINGTEDTYESPDLLLILPSEKLSILWDRETLGSYRRVFLTERVVAQTVIEPAVPDDLGRDGIVNHTVLYKFDSTITHDGMAYVFDYEQFAKDARAGKYNFKMPEVPELKKPLDYPPPMEVTT
jgi:hypothetical protein